LGLPQLQSVVTGAFVDSCVGSGDGLFVGLCVVGEAVGARVGDLVGSPVGELVVGAPVG
jgi:hypothetical protein